MTANNASLIALVLSRHQCRGRFDPEVSECQSACDHDSSGCGYQACLQPFIVMCHTPYSAVNVDNIVVGNIFVFSFVR